MSNDNIKREIKFRAWYDKGMFEPVLVGGSQVPQVFDADHNLVNLCAHTEEYYVMQYTGLKDKIGVEIYEGDIVGWRSDYKLKQPDCKMEVTITVKAGDIKLTPYINQDCEVIGNIYENAELLI